MEATKKAVVAPTPTPVSEPTPTPTSATNENQAAQTAIQTETPQITDSKDPKDAPDDSHNNNKSSLDGEDAESREGGKKDTEQNTVSVTSGIITRITQLMIQ